MIRIMRKIIASTSILSLTLLVLGACSRDYSPDPKASGEEIYLAACAECHKADDKGTIFHIDPKNANPTYVIHKVKSGSILMPSFPNIKAGDFKNLTAFVLANSSTE